MAPSELDSMVLDLITGFEALRNDYTALYQQHSILEHKLETAREQYNELAKLYGKTTVDTPPLSLASASSAPKRQEDHPLSATDILRLRDQHGAVKSLRAAEFSCEKLLARMSNEEGTAVGLVRNWSEPEQNSRLPSISESPMEQDFTIAGTPSRLGCPFASMSGKKLSNHAASVLSRYHGTQQDGRTSSRGGGSANGSAAVSRSGSISQRRPSERRRSLLDPIKAEMCGLDHHESIDAAVPTQSLVEIEDGQPTEGEVGVCPIRFLNQHSPEELATYFEQHKHELPRSHEVCVRRYQSNEEQVRELDARYGDVAQMIRGLGEKHQSFLPKEPDEEAEENSHDDSRVQEWAKDIENSERHGDTLDVDDTARQPHFARPLRDIRVGESPSRPWGISVPPEYHEHQKSDASSIPAPALDATPDQLETTQPAKCPFAAMMKGSDGDHDKPPDGHPPLTRPSAASAAPKSETALAMSSTSENAANTSFSGPIIVGYGPEEAALFLRKLGYRGA